MVCLKWPISVSLLLLFPLSLWAAVDLRDEGTSQAFVWNLNCVGANISCTASGADGTLTISGGGVSNSFETLSVPAGTAPVADSSTDTLTITETSFLTITGTAATDTIDITQVTTDLGTDGLIAANAVALTTDTTGNYVEDVTAGVGLSKTSSASEGQTVDLAFASTEVEATTWGAGGNASNLWTFNLSGTDPTLNVVSGGLDLTGKLNVDQSNQSGFAAEQTNFYVENADIGLASGTTLTASRPTRFDSHTLAGVAGGAVETVTDAANVYLDTAPSGTNVTITRTYTLWSDDGLNRFDGDVVVGGVASLGKLSVDGDADEIQLLVQGNATQTTSLLVAEQSDGTDVLTLTNAGALTTADDITISTANPNLTLDPTVGDSFGFHVEPSTSVAFINNETDGVHYLEFQANHTIDIGIGSSVPSIRLFTNGTGNSEIVLPTDSIGADELDTADVPADGELLSYQGSSGRMIWSAAGAGDITDVYNCASGDCNNIVLADGDLLNMSSVSVSTTTEGLILPQHATDCSTAGTAEGQVCWEADANTFYVGNGTTVTQIGAGGTDTNADLMIRLPAVAMMPLEAADSIPPIAKDAGTTVDQLVVDFDQSTDECRTTTIEIPADITSGGTVTFTFWWYAASVTTGNVIWDIRHNSGVAEGVDPDAALTTEASAADAVQGTAGQVTRTTFTETQTNLAWATNDLVDVVACRDANAVGDTMAADARLKEITINIPRS